MHRGEFRKYFKSMGPVVLPVIHVLDSPQAKRNLATVAECGAPGAFLINHDFDVAQFLPIIEDCRKAYPDLWLGGNFLGISGEIAFPILSELKKNGTGVDAYWADDARIDERVEGQAEAESIAGIRETGLWDGLYFGGTAFKKQRDVESEKYRLSAGIAANYMDVVTTSGVATGQPAVLQKILDFREGVGDSPLAIASGISPENVSDYMEHADAFLVATGVNVPGDFYNLDPRRLRQLLEQTRRFAARAGGVRAHRGRPARAGGGRARDAPRLPRAGRASCFG